MKITIYELLGLIKDGKAPKTITKIAGNRIKYDKFLFYDEELKNYYDKDGNHPLFTDDIALDLNDEIEIIEKDRKIGKINRADILDDKKYMLSNILYLSNKINQIIDKLNEGDK